MAQANIPHIPVLKDEVLAELIHGRTGALRIIDGTVGFGGHAEAFLRALPEAQYLGLDRDTHALDFARERLAFAQDRVTLEHATFSSMKACAQQHGFEQADIILLDIGVSSAQIDDAARGFSFKHDAALDMRMDQNSALTAATLLNTAEEAELARIFRDYGEVRDAKRLAAAVCTERKRKAFVTTHDFAALCDKTIHMPRTSTLPAPTLPFQALRIAVNNELGELESVLPDAVGLLSGGGRFGVISFHSLEDRIVKQFFRYESEACHCPPHLPVCICGHTPKITLVNRKVIVATEEEVQRNSRSACAKFRVIERLQPYSTKTTISRGENQ